MKVFVWVVLLCFPILAFCQDGVRNLYGNRWLVNERDRYDTTRTHYHLAYSTTGVINNANSIKSYILNNALKVSVIRKNVAVNFNSNYVYGQQSHILTNNDFTSSLDVNLYQTLKHFYYWGLGDYTSSFSLQINEQEQAGLGVGYDLIHAKKATLNLSEGLLYERDNLYDSLYGGPEGSLYQHDQYETVRNSFRLLYHWAIGKGVALDGSDFFQNALDNSRDYILKLSASVSVRLNKWLSVTSAAQYNQFTRTRTKNDIVTFGVTIVR